MSEIKKQPSFNENLLTDSDSACYQLAGKVLDALVTHAMIVPKNHNPIQAFKVSYRQLPDSPSTLKVIEACDELAAMMGEEPLKRSLDTLEPIHRPMLVPPRPWEPTITTRGEFYAGSPYFLYDVPLMRVGFQKAQYERLKDGDISKFVEGVNVVQSLPWQIHSEVFKVIEHLFEVEGGGMCDIPLKSGHQVPARKTQVV